MKSLLLYWHPVPVYGRKGNLFATPLPELIDHYSNGTLLANALAMPKKSPIHFDLVIKFASDIIHDADIGHEPGQHFWYKKNFVQWISDLGYHIEFTGDEFDLLTPPVIES
jgi:hypothetical protein